MTNAELINALQKQMSTDNNQQADLIDGVIIRLRTAEKMAVDLSKHGNEWHNDNCLEIEDAMKCSHSKCLETFRLLEEWNNE